MLDLKSCIPYSEGLKMLIVRLRNDQFPSPTWTLGCLGTCILGSPETWTPMQKSEAPSWTGNLAPCGSPPRGSFCCPLPPPSPASPSSCSRRFQTWSFSSAGTCSLDTPSGGEVARSPPPPDILTSPCRPAASTLSQDSDGGRWLLPTRKSRRLNLCKSTFEM